MKAACLVLTAVILVSIMAVCVMVKFATEITVEDKLIQDDFAGKNVFRFTKSMGVIALNENSSLDVSNRFPYVAAITRNSSSTWSFACFGSIILIKWVVTSAHCRKQGSTHRVLLYHDYVSNVSHTYPILFWRIHEKYNSSNPTPKYDIAVAKLNIDYRPFTLKSSMVDEEAAVSVVAGVWKTVSTMDRKLFLTNAFEVFEVKIVHQSRCYESYGVYLDQSMFCIDMSEYDDCFVHEFGPVYYGDKVVGIIAVKPRECDMKLAIFTNVSYHTNWILVTTRTTLFH